MSPIKIYPKSDDPQLGGDLSYSTCSSRWLLIDPAEALLPLIALALSLDESYDPMVWNFQCKLHNHYFRIGNICPEGHD